MGADLHVCARTLCIAHLSGLTGDLVRSIGIACHLWLPGNSVIIDSFDYIIAQNSNTAALVVATLLFFYRTSTGFPLTSGSIITAIYWKIGRSSSCIGFTGVRRLYTVD